MIEQMVNSLPADFEPKTIFELGVFDGKQSVELSDRFKSAHVYSFDCSPNCVPDILKAVAGRSNITFTQVAVGDIDKDTVFKMCKSTKWGPRGSGSLRELCKVWTPEWEQIDIPVHITRLDTWANANNVTSVDLIWSDLQGCDYEAFVGMGSLLDTVQAVYAEVMYERLYVNQMLFNDVDRLLTSRGFTLKANWPLPPPHVFGDALWLRVKK